ncbi:hypothetical protein [Pedobacter sp. NJ-S-72]
MDRIINASLTLFISFFSLNSGLQPGLGLQLCRDSVEKNKVWLKVSKEEGCVVLRFNLPKFKAGINSVPD